MDRPAQTQPEKVLILGAGGHAKIVAASIEARGKYQVAGILDDDRSRHGTEVYGYAVLAGLD